MTALGKICGWQDEEKLVCSVFAACMWIYTKGVLTEWGKPTPEMQEYLKRRMLSFVLCVNWVCEGAFDDHEWVSVSTIAMQENLRLRSLYSVRGAMVHVVVFRAHTVKSNIGRRRKKNREVPRSCGHGDCIRDRCAFWRFTHTAGVHVDNGGCSFVKNTNRKCDVNKGWRMEGRLVLFRLLMMMAMMFPMNDVHWNN